MKYVFLYLAVANAMDGVLSYIGLRFSFIEEWNPLMEMVYMTEPFYFFMVKGLLSGFLLLFCFSKKSLHGSSFVMRLSMLAAMSYTAILFLHGYWIVHII